MTELDRPDLTRPQAEAGALHEPDSDIVRGPLNKALVRLALPAIAAKALYAILGMVDIFWVGRLGAAATAAVNTSFFTSWILEASTSLTSIGILAHVARSIGARRATEAGRAASQGLTLGLLLGVLLAALAWVLTPWLFQLLGTNEDVRQAGMGYLRVIFLAAPLTFTYINCEAIMRAAGNARTPMLVTSGMVVVNAGLDPLLIFGLGPFPALGVLGAGVATLIAQGFACAVFAVLALGRHPNLPLHWPDFGRLQRRMVSSLIRVGLPAMSIGIFFSTIYLFLSGVAARMGTLELAILGLGNRAETFTYWATMGFGSATGAMVGQNLGAGQPDRAAKAAWWSALWMGLWGSLVGAVMIFFPRAILQLFTNDEALLEIGTTYLRILGLCQGLMSLELVFENAFAGAGDTLPPMLISVPINLIRIPLVLWIVYQLQAGILGVAWLLSITSAIRGVIGAVWFSRGRWKHRKLHAEVDPTLDVLGG